MKELSRTELATVKRTAANVKTFRAKKAKLEASMAKLAAELETINKSIDLFEAPILEVTGGYTSEQVLSGEMDAALRQLKTNEEPVEEVVNEETTSYEETSAVEQEQPAPVFPLFGSAQHASPLPFQE